MWNILNMLHILRFFLFKMLFVFIMLPFLVPVLFTFLHTGCAKIKKKIRLQKVNTATSDNSSKMLRPCKWAIIRLFTELVRRLYTRHGEYLGDEISSYIIVCGINTGYQCFIYVCASNLKCMHSHYLTLACRWPSVII
jgi:hypothetical protein